MSLHERLSALTEDQRDRLRALLRVPGEDVKPTARRFSLFFFAAAHERDARAQYQLMLDCARFADTHGFEAIWVPERHFDRFGAPYPSPSVLAAAIAAVTRRVGIRAGSVVLPLHDPISVAEEWAVIDNLSGGRAAMAWASGWHPNDFVLAPECYDKRKQILLDHLATVRGLFAGETVTRRDGSGREVSIQTYPRPLRAQVPMWLTSMSSVQTWQTAAEEGLNVLTGLIDQDIDGIQQKVAAYDKALRAAGRDRSEHTVTAMLHTFIGKQGEDVRALVREPLTNYLREHLDLYAKFAQSQELSVDPDSVTAADRDALARFGFERYFATHGLFGTPAQAMHMVRRLAEAGVDEIACLVDFGIPAEMVLSHLEDLAILKELASAETR